MSLGTRILKSQYHRMPVRWEVKAKVDEKGGKESGTGNDGDVHENREKHGHDGMMSVKRLKLAKPWEDMTGLLKFRGRN